MLSTTEILESVRKAEAETAAKKTKKTKNSQPVRHSTKCRRISTPLEESEESSNSSLYGDSDYSGCVAVG
jgi:hypothetical protein